MPILENFLFELSKDELRITASDIEITMTATVNVKGENDGKVVVPAKRLMETVRALPNLTIRFAVDLATNKMVMTTEHGEYRLTGYSSEDYPTIPHVKGTDDLSIEAKTLSRMINKTSFAVSTDELRPAMMGVLFQIKKNSLRAVATDGHRLVKISDVNFSSEKIERDIIVPAKALNIVARTMEEEANKITLDGNHIVFNFDSTVIVSKLIEEKYPNYEAVIPTDNPRTLIINKADLLTAMRRVVLYSNATTHQVRFSIKSNSLTVSAEDVDFGSDATETLTCKYDSEEMDIGFNGNYVVDILSHMDSDEVVFRLSSGTRAVVVNPGEQKQGEEIVMLVMPVRLNV